MKTPFFFSVFLLIFIVAGQVFAESPQCTYSTWEWNTRTKRSEKHRKIRKPYAEITSSEKDPHSQCTVCEEDQVTVAVPDLPPFRVCKHHAEVVRRAVEKIVQAGFPIKTIIAYRVGRTKGPVNQLGYRTQFSNHSFGTAIDFNSELNGLYDKCFNFGKHCRLLRGGPWRPEKAGTVTKDSIVYEVFSEMGWRWAGELKGQQKDFMHFSLSGD